MDIPESESLSSFLENMELSALSRFVADVDLNRIVITSRMNSHQFAFAVETKYGGILIDTAGSLRLDSDYWF